MIHYVVLWNQSHLINDRHMKQSHTCGAIHIQIGASLSLLINSWCLFPETSRKRFRTWNLSLVQEHCGLTLFVSTSPTSKNALTRLSSWIPSTNWHPRYSSGLGAQIRGLRLRSPSFVIRKIYLSGNTSNIWKKTTIIMLHYLRLYASFWSRAGSQGCGRCKSLRLDVIRK